MRSWAKSYGGIQSAVRHSSTASSKRPRFDCISMRLVDLVGLILLGGWKEVSERCFVGKMALHQNRKHILHRCLSTFVKPVTVFQISSSAFCRVLSGIWCRYWAHARKALWAGKPWRFFFFPLGFLTMPLAANVSGFYRKHDDICRPEAWMTLVGSMCTWWLRDFDFDPYCLVVWNTNVIFFHINWE